MCNRCPSYFTIHNVEELRSYLRAEDNKDIVKVWLEREYITNLIYLEWKHGHK